MSQHESKTECKFVKDSIKAARKCVSAVFTAETDVQDPKPKGVRKTVVLRERPKVQREKTQERGRRAPKRLKMALLLISRSCGIRPAVLTKT